MIDQINKQIHRALVKHGRSLQGYYDVRVKSGEVLNPADRRLITRITQCFGVDTPIVEIAAGVGQVSHALAVYGYPVVMVEVDPARIEASMAIGEYLGTRVPVLRAHWQILDLSFAKVICTVNSVNSSNEWRRDLELLEQYVIAGTHVIINPTLFGKSKDEDQRLPYPSVVDIGNGLYHWMRELVA